GLIYNLVSFSNNKMGERLSTDEVLAKYGKKIESQLSSYEPDESYSREYESFKGEMIPELSRYERWANSLGNMLRLKVSEKDRVKIQRYLDIAKLNVDASQALTLALISMLLVFFLTLLSATAYVFIAFP